MIRRHHRCLGIRLWKWRRKQLEIWFCPMGEVIAPHIHHRIDSRIVFLFGDMFGQIGPRSGVLTTRDFLRRFHVPAGVQHSASMNRFTIFANWETWEGLVTSAADDFTAV